MAYLSLARPSDMNPHLRISLASLPLLYYDNLSAFHMTINPVFHAHSKHIELDYHYVCERVALGHLVTHHIPTNDQVANLFTKSVSKATLMHFRTKLCLQPRPRLREDINNNQLLDDNHAEKGNKESSHWKQISMIVLLIMESCWKTNLF